jgi:hypothetical protein
MPGLTKDEMKRRTDAAVEEATAELQQRIQGLEAQLAQQDRPSQAEQVEVDPKTYIAIADLWTPAGVRILADQLDELARALEFAAQADEIIAKREKYKNAEIEDLQARIKELEAYVISKDGVIDMLKAKVVELETQPSTNQVDLEQMTDEELGELFGNIRIERRVRQDRFMEEMKAKTAAQEAGLAELKAQAAAKKTQDEELDLDPAAPHGGSDEKAVEPVTNEETDPKLIALNNALAEAGLPGRWERDDHHSGTYHWVIGEFEQKFTRGWEELVRRLAQDYTFKDKLVVEPWKFHHVRTYERMGDRPCNHCQHYTELEQQLAARETTAENASGCEHCAATKEHEQTWKLSWEQCAEELAFVKEIKQRVLEENDTLKQQLANQPVTTDTSELQTMYNNVVEAKDKFIGRYF